MPLDALAGPDDLLDRNITADDDVDLYVLLDSASAAIRDAAGHPISQIESTVVLVVDSYRCIDLPAGPVASVSSVQVGGVALSGWSKIGDTLIMPSGWTRCLPVEVTVTYIHGYPVVPADIVDLVCGMAAMAIEVGYGTSGRSTSVKLGNFAETDEVPAGSDSPSPVAIPNSVRARLQARFNASVATIGQR